MSHFGTFIREQRRMLNMTQRELAEKVGVDDRLIDDIEATSTRPIDNYLFVQLALALGTTGPGLEVLTDPRIRLAEPEEIAAAKSPEKNQ